VLVRAGEIMARSGMKTDGITLVTEAAAGIYKSSRHTEDKVFVAVEAGEVFAKYGNRQNAINAMIVAYQLASNSPKEGLFPEMNKVRSFTIIARALAETPLK
jgi:hypothetical protein